MRLSCVLLIAVVVLLSSCDDTSANNTGQALKTKTMESGDALVPDTTQRLLRTQQISGTDAVASNDEERAPLSLKNLLNVVRFKAATNDFARSNLDKMLSDPIFKMEMFQRWNAKYSADKIIRILDISKTKNIPYGAMLQEFLNTYGRRPIKTQ
ncbi:hypothetical protein AM587_10003113 [Phytophthora nicotianae]|uniref:RxLR effector protein n=1 Tax=Phytophthora nicotianae TaxID=4792 RepID=A0A0W8CBB9_PHYNI|nr:hypothetical protein AM587_10003113 [Phytophthora nicotianae]